MTIYRLLFLLPLVTAFPAFAQPPQKPYDNSHFARPDSVTIHYRIWNDDLPNPKGKVLLIHGFCGSTFCWRNSYDTLVKSGYRVVAVDLPGFGYSERSATLNQSQSYRARLIWDLLTEIDGSDTTRWNIVGHSMGGGTAEAVALTDPGRTKSLTIVAGMVFVNNKDVNSVIVGLTNSKLYKSLLLSYMEHTYLSFKNFRKELKSIYGYLPDTVTVNEFLTPMSIEGSAETVINLIANAKEIQSLNAEGLKDLNVQVIWGKKDKTIRLRNAKKLTRVAPNIELKVIPDAYHIPMETNPEEFNPLLVNFLNRFN
jgi:pimeloyl-ACP methyl ester carboxylesterase